VRDTEPFAIRTRRVDGLAADVDLTEVIVLPALHGLDHSVQVFEGPADKVRPVVSAWRAVEG